MAKFMGYYSATTILRVSGIGIDLNSINCRRIRYYPCMRPYIINITCSLSPRACMYYYYSIYISISIKVILGKINERVCCNDSVVGHLLSVVWPSPHTILAICIIRVRLWKPDPYRGHFSLNIQNTIGVFMVEISHTACWKYIFRKY